MSNTGIEGTRKFSLSGWFLKQDLEAVVHAVSAGRRIYLAKAACFSSSRQEFSKLQDRLFSNQIKSSNLNAEIIYIIHIYSHNCNYVSRIQ